MKKDNVNQQKNSVKNEETSDFVVGEIAGMDENPSKQAKQATPASAKANLSVSLTQKAKERMSAENEGSAEKQPAPKEKPVEKPADKAVAAKKVEVPDNHVSLKIRKQVKPLVDVISKSNENVLIQDFDDYFQVSAEQMRVSRYDVEHALGKMSDGRWRMLFVNREGDISVFTDNEFVLGIVEEDVQERKETAQINTRVAAEAKKEMDTMRALLAMTQPQFLEAAIKEYSEKIREEML